jgi:hypothetical protein
MEVLGLSLERVAKRINKTKEEKTIEDVLTCPGCPSKYSSVGDPYLI